VVPGKGGKNRRRGKNDTEGSKREITFKEDGQGAGGPLPTRGAPHADKAARPASTFYVRIHSDTRSSLALHITKPPLPPIEYAQVTRMLGNGRLEAFCFDGVNRLCHIRGKLRKRVWIGVVSVPHATQLPCVPHPSG